MRNEVLGNFKVILRHVKGGKGSMVDVGTAARGLEAAAGRLLPLFPKGTGRPNYSDEETRSLNKIWELCGFKSKEEFEESFKTIYGTTFKDYISKL